MSKKPLYRIEPLNNDHNRVTFSCGIDALNNYFQTQVTQDIRRRITNCFVVVSVETGEVAAYYSMASASIPTPDLPEEEIKRLPRYPTIPAIRIGRLAVDKKYQGFGIGRMLVVDAMTKALASTAAAYALLVDAKNDQAVLFYQKNGFRQLTGLPRVLFLPLATAQKALTKYQNEKP